MTDSIAIQAWELAERFGTRDPFEIAGKLGIHVLLRDNFTTLKGMYRVIKKSRFIFINSKLDRPTRNIVCAHELGHDMLHRELAKDGAFHDLRLLAGDSKREIEANIFAAHLLIDGDRVLRLAKHGYTADYIAATLRTDPGLVSLVIERLISKGHPLSPVDRKNNILK